MRLPELKHVIAAAIVSLVIGLWAYQVYLPKTAPDTMLYTFAMVIASAAAVSLFGKGTVSAGVDVVNRVQKMGKEEK